MLITIDDILFRDGCSVGEISEAIEFWANHYNGQTLLRVFVAKDKSVAYVEAVHKRLSVASSSHKLIESIKTPYPPVIVSLRDFDRFCRCCVTQCYNS